MVTKFSARFTHLLLFLKYVKGSDLTSKIEVIYATSAVLFYIFHTKAFLIKKSQCKVQVNVVTPQELGGEIYGGKNCFVFDC